MNSIHNWPACWVDKQGEVSTDDEDDETEKKAAGVLWQSKLPDYQVLHVSGAE